MPEPIRLENGYGCYCADCAGSWIQNDKDSASTIRLCGCPCHEEDDEHDEDAPCHDDTCDCDDCCGDEEEEPDHSDGPVPGCNCHDCIQ